MLSFKQLDSINKRTLALSEDSDQPMHLPSLSTWTITTTWNLNIYPQSEHQRLDRTNAQADLSCIYARHICHCVGLSDTGPYASYIFACWVIFHAFVVVCWLFFKLTFSKNSFPKIFQENFQSVKRIGFRSGPTLCRSWSDSKLFAKVTSRQTK